MKEKIKYRGKSFSYKKRLKMQCWIHQFLLMIAITTILMMATVVINLDMEGEILKFVRNCIVFFSICLILVPRMEELDSGIEKMYKKKKKRFRRKKKKKEFFQYLGKRRIEVEFHLNRKSASEEFMKVIRNPETKWYVEWIRGELLHMTAYNGTDKIWDEIVNYRFFNLYFRELVHHSNPVSTEKIGRAHV